MKLTAEELYALLIKMDQEKLKVYITELKQKDRLDWTGQYSQDWQAITEMAMGCQAE